MSGLEPKPRAICILGMHRSGTSTVTRAINLLGAYLGNEGLMPATPANPEGYWERIDIFELQKRLFKELGRDWDTAVPLPDGWTQSKPGRTFKADLTQLVKRNFIHQKLWAWKDPKTCLLLPVWREVLDELGIELVCVFVVRGPVDVAKSMNKRDGIPLEKGYGIWFNHYFTGLKEAAGLPGAFLSYDRFLESWGNELRKCATELNVPWPAEDQALRTAMNSFLKPGLRHNQSAAAELKAIPQAVRELYGLLMDACDRSGRRDGQFDAVLNRFDLDFKTYAASLADETDATPTGKSQSENKKSPSIADARPPYWQRTWQRWQRSFQKRFGR